MKKTVSLILTVLMAMSIITVASSASAAEVAKVNGVNCYVGQEVEFIYNLQTPGKAEDFQGHFEYTDGLKVEAVHVKDASNVMEDGTNGVMINSDIDNYIYYSGVNVTDGYSFTSDDSCFYARFKVEKAGEYTITNKLEILSGMDGTQYVDNYKAIESVKTSEKIVAVPYAVDNIVLDVNEKTIYNGSKFTIKATVTPEMAALTNEVTWESSDPSVATVENGVVTGKKAGTCNIIAFAGEIGKICKVTVKQHVTSVKLNATSKTLYNGKSTTLKATVNPSNAANKAVTWSTSNKNVATVNAKGVVTAKKPGKAIITVKTKDLGKTAKCTIVVKAQKATKVTVSKKSAVLQKKGNSVVIKATVSPSNTYNKSITVSNSNKKAVKVSATKITSGKTVKITALKKGTSNVKFTAADGSRKSATVKVTVKK